MPTFDAVVVGAGPAGSVAALVLARSGARVALIDRRRFPRDKACGDLIGPRGVRLLEDLGLSVPDARHLGDMIVVGPSGRRSLLPALPGADYADHAIAVGRSRFDAMLYDAAVSAGAHPIHGRVTSVHLDPSASVGVGLSGGSAAGRGASSDDSSTRTEFVAGDVVIGADGANSQVASLAGLVDGATALWGFALRSYLEGEVDLPYIVLWEPQAWRLFPGYGWAFPTDGGGANVGLGLAFSAADRAASRQAGEQLGAFVEHLARLGLPLRQAVDRTPNSLGGWLKMGMVGTNPTAGRVLLVGDAAGMINPLQGEGIAQAMATGQAAASAVIAAGPDGAADHYRQFLRTSSHHHRLNAAVHAAIVAHPRAVSLAGRALTAPGVRTAMSGAWGLYWNDLVSGALPSRHRTLATAMSRVVAAAVARRPATAWFTAQLGTRAPRIRDRPAAPTPHHHSTERRTDERS